MQSDLHRRALDVLNASPHDAVRFLGEALKQTESSELWNDWAAAVYCLQPVRAAELGFRRALHLDPQNTIAAANLNTLLEQARRAEENERDADHRNILQVQLARLRAQPPLPSRSGRNLVVGTATNYGKREIAPFVTSLRRTGFNGDIILFVTEVDPPAKQFLAEQRVRLERWDGMFLPFDVQLGRFVTYYNFLARLSLETSHHSYDWIFLTDVRDVFFQQDPFSPEPETDVLVFLEDESKCLGSCNFNSAWIRSAFGEPMLAKMAAQRISCSGTVLGSWHGILEYLLIMQILTTHTAREARFLKGVDQGIHNVVVHEKLLRSCSAVPNGERVLTLGYVPEKDVQITSNGKIADRKGRISQVIHQFDRHPKLVELVQRVLG